MKQYIRTTQNGYVTETLTIYTDCATCRKVEKCFLTSNFTSYVRYCPCKECLVKAMCHNLCQEKILLGEMILGKDLKISFSLKGVDT